MEQQARQTRTYAACAERLFTPLLKEKPMVFEANIDNGFGAGHPASMINHTEAKK